MRALLGAITLCCGLLALAASGATGRLILRYGGLCLLAGGALAWRASAPRRAGMRVVVVLFGLAMMFWRVGIITYDVVTFTHTGDPAPSIQ